ncbi:MAG TPA: 50S ribosomal protein L18 [Candidatus Paceibacterota bacterium]
MIKETRRKRRILRHARVRAKIAGNATKPRLVVFRSNKHLYVQLIDDEKNMVLAAVSDLKLKSKKRGIERVKDLAAAMAGKAKEKAVQKIVFDRGGYKYHGQIKVLAEELRAQGIIF